MDYTSKEDAARKVAAKYSCHIDQAVITFMEKTGLLEASPNDFKREVRHHFDDIKSLLAKVRKEDPSFVLDDDQYHYQCQITHAEPFLKAQEEMLSLLKEGYRHPVENALVEQEIFLGDIGAIPEELTIGHDCWLRNDKDLMNLPSPLREKILEYMDRAEDNLRHYQDCQRERSNLRARMANAKDAYKRHSEKDTSKKRNARVVHELGFSTGRKGRTKSINHYAAYYEYVHLVRHKEKTQHESVETIRKEFGYASLDAATKALHDSLLKVKRWWARREQPPDLDKYWVGLIPDRRRK